MRLQRSRSPAAADVVPSPNPGPDSARTPGRAGGPLASQAEGHCKSAGESVLSDLNAMPVTCLGRVHYQRDSLSLTRCGAVLVTVIMASGLLSGTGTVTGRAVGDSDHHDRIRAAGAGGPGQPAGRPCFPGPSTVTPSGILPT